MAIRRAAHASYNIQYHFVWIPKYRKLILEDEIHRVLEKMLHEICERYDFIIEELAIAKDHVHVFFYAPPRYAPSKIVEILKSITAKQLFARFPSLKQQLWGGHLWSRGYYVGTSGDKVTNEIIMRYIRYQRDEERPSKEQMDLF
jgi:putative transposase